MKILITSDWYSPAVNGVVTSVKNLRRALEARGHEVRVLTLSQTHRSWEQNGVTYLGSVAAGLVYPGARLRTALSGKWVRELIAWSPDDGKQCACCNRRTRYWQNNHNKCHN